MFLFALECIIATQAWSCRDNYTMCIYLVLQVWLNSQTKHNNPPFRIWSIIQSFKIEIVLDKTYS